MFQVAHCSWRRHSGEVYREKLQKTCVAVRLLSSRQLALGVCALAIMSLLAGVHDARTRVLKGLETSSGESCGVSNPDPLLSEHTEFTHVAGPNHRVSRV